MSNAKKETGTETLHLATGDLADKVNDWSS